MQDVDKKCVVLEEVISLETAAISDPKIREEFGVVGCAEADRMRDEQNW